MMGRGTSGENQNSIITWNIKKIIRGLIPG